MTDENLFEANLQGHYSCYYCGKEIQYSFLGKNWRHTKSGVARCDCVATPINIPIGE